MAWALSQLDDLLPGASDQSATIESVAGDASSRAYYRVTCADATWIVAHAPPATEKNQAFVDLNTLLWGADVRVPSLHAVDFERGLLLLEDLGDAPLLEALSQASDQDADALYKPAFALLEQLARVPTDTLAAYDRPLLEEELSRFETWFVDALLGYQMADAEQALVAKLFDRLMASALEQPAVFVHRDFHSRNLMRLEAASPSLAVIDFQDAVVGPVTYDAVSLLRDCYIAWPPESIARWLEMCRTRYAALGLLNGISREQFQRWFDWMGLQRHLKVLGTFARLARRDGKAAYLADLPLVIQYVRQVLAAHRAQEPSFAAFDDWFSQVLMPLIGEQPWATEALSMEIVPS